MIRLVNNFLIHLLIILFLSTKAFGNTQFFKCAEKISNVIKGESSLIKKNSEIGENYIKFSNLNSSFRKVTIKFKEKDNTSSFKKIINNKDIKMNTLGYEIFEKYSDSEETIENFYTFVKVDKTFAFTRNQYYWSSNKDKKNFEYESSGRCVKINRDEFNNVKKIKKVLKKDNNKKTNKLKNNSDFSKIIKGQRPIAMTWEGYEDLILGKINFSEKEQVGTLEFNLPNKDGNCIGTYVLSRVKGTWSIYCEKKDLNASGFLKWNSEDGSVSGNGKDNKGKKIKFKIGSIN